MTRALMILAAAVTVVAAPRALGQNWQQLLDGHDRAFARRVAGTDGRFVISWPAAQQDALRVRLEHGGRAVDVEPTTEARKWLGDEIHATPVTHKPEPRSTIKYANGFGPARLIDELLAAGLTTAPQAFTASLHRDGADTLLMLVPELRNDGKERDAALVVRRPSGLAAHRLVLHGTPTVPSVDWWTAVPWIATKPNWNAHVSERAIVLSATTGAIAFVPRGPTVAFARHLLDDAVTDLPSGERFFVWSKALVDARIQRVPPFVVKGSAPIPEHLPTWLAKWSPAPGKPRQDPLLWFFGR